MKVLVIGATGYIGGSVAKTLVDKGHEVMGMLRNPQQMEALSNMGIRSILGSLEDKQVLRQAIQLSDAVINAADSDHREGVATIIEALRGTGKTFIHTSGSSIVSDDALGEYESEKIYSDDTPFTPISIRKDRVHINQVVRVAGITEGMRTMVIVPPMIYGDGLGLATHSDQLPKLIRKSKEAQAGVYIGKGLNRVSNVHIQDLVNLYVLALEKGPSAATFYAKNGEESLFTLAQSISHALGYAGKTASWSAVDAIAEWGDWARFALGSNSRVRATHARRLLGWQPQAESVLAWIAKSTQSSSV